MLTPDQQNEVVQRIAAAAAGRGLLVAPVGSAYFIMRGGQSLETKDIDTVIHSPDLDIPPVETILALGRDLGEVEVAEDNAVVKVYLDGPKGGPDTIEAELLRGRRYSSGGFLPRDLLRTAAKGATRRGNLLSYPPEFVLVLKADAAVDRGSRAARNPERAERNRRRAEAFRADVFREMPELLGSGTLKEASLRTAVGLLKKNRRKAVAELLNAASGGRLKLD